MTKLVLICWWVLCWAVAVSVTGSSVDRVLVSVIPWEPGNQAMMGSPRPWDPDTIHRSWSSSKPHCITNNLNSHAHKTLSVTKYDQMFYTCPGAYESQILSVYPFSFRQLSSHVLKLLGFEFEHLQQWLESRLWRDQFLNFSTVIPRVWARPRPGRVMLSSVSHTGGTFTDKETQKVFENKRRTHLIFKL